MGETGRSGLFASRYAVSFKPWHSVIFVTNGLVLFSSSASVFVTNLNVSEVNCTLSGPCVFSQRTGVLSKLIIIDAVRPKRGPTDQ